jgi:prophage regulatory protein
VSETLLSRQEVERRTKLSRSSIYDRMAAGTFPLGRRAPGEWSVWWVESEVDAWIADRIARSVPVGTMAGRKSQARKKPLDSAA